MICKNEGVEAQNKCTIVLQQEMHMKNSGSLNHSCGQHATITFAKLY